MVSSSVDRISGCPANPRETSAAPLSRISRAVNLFPRVSEGFETLKTLTSSRVTCSAFSRSRVARRARMPMPALKSHQQQCQRAHQHHSGLVTLQELGAAVAPRVAARDDRKALQITPDVVGLLGIGHLWRAPSELFALRLFLPAP